MRPRLVLIASILLLALPPVAEAGSVKVAKGKIVYAGSNRAERILVGPDLIAGGSGPELRYSLADLSGRRIDAGAGCRTSESTPGTTYCRFEVKGIELRMRGGDDQAGVSAPLTVPSTFDGGEGDDRLSGETTGPRLTLLGGPGGDFISGAADGAKGAIKASGGGGADWIAGSCGRKDVLSGGAGGDEIFAKDGVRDEVDGGGGNDYAAVDAADRRSGVEKSSRRDGRPCSEVTFGFPDPSG